MMFLTILGLVGGKYYWAWTSQCMQSTIQNFKSVSRMNNFILLVDNWIVLLVERYD